MKIAALYARVSTADGEQNPETQLVALRKHAETMGYEVDREYVDLAGATDMSRRAQWFDLLNHQSRFDVILVTRIDRAWRSLLMMFTDLADLKSNGKDFHAITQPIDTTQPTGRLLLGILGVVAEFERDLIRDRTNEGLARAAAEGRKGGRRKGTKDKKPRKPRSDKGKRRKKRGGDANKGT